jgi:hypothetical protein
MCFVWLTPRSSLPELVVGRAFLPVQVGIHNSDNKNVCITGSDVGGDGTRKRIDIRQYWFVPSAIETGRLLPATPSGIILLLWLVHP